MSEPVLLLAQIDDAPGELLADVMDQLTDLGAVNIQLLANIGKKGRPGHTLLVDIPADAEDEVALLLAGEIGIWGYRVLRSEHRHLDIRRATVDLDLRAGGTVHRAPLRVKRIFGGGRFLRVKAEHDDLARICADLKKAGHLVPLAVLKSRVEVAVDGDEPVATLSIDLDHGAGA
ncbi:MAG: hypothetical protein ABS81_05490 [Pseudonocardia sp. SCN 72-86]|nr:MAG: hypothetical protein ABS81_05490 [Pseudonocardia sp. SCN 72-86]